MPAKRSKKIVPEYNAPVTLTVTLAACAIFLLDYTVFHGLIKHFFTAPSSLGSSTAFNYRSIADYLRLCTHIAGSVSPGAFAMNLPFLLLLGPLVEQRYGSVLYTLMIAVCAFVSGVVNVCFFASPLTGSSGIVWMLLVLSLFSARDKKSIQLSFVCLVLFFICREITVSAVSGTYACVPSFAGGTAGCLFHLAAAKEPAPARKRKEPAAPKEQKIPGVPGVPEKKETAVPPPQNLI